MHPFRLVHALMLGLAAAACQSREVGPSVSPEDSELILAMTASCVAELRAGTGLTETQIEDMCGCMAPVTARHLPAALLADLRAGQAPARSHEPIDPAALDAALRRDCPQVIPYLDEPAGP